MEHEEHSELSLKENNFICQNNICLSFTIFPLIEKRKKEVGMKRCVEVATMVVKHLFVDFLMPSHCSKSCRRVDREIIDSMRIVDGCGGCVVGYLVGGENADQVLHYSKP